MWPIGPVFLFCRLATVLQLDIRYQVIRLTLGKIELIEGICLKPNEEHKFFILIGVFAFLNREYPVI